MAVIIPAQAAPLTKLKAIRLMVPEDVHDRLRRQADREGITLQGLVAPIVNAYGRGDIRQEFTR